MISSMTGFGRGEAERDGYRAIFEVSSLNSRFLEVSVRTPRWMMSFEPGLRALISSRAGRGKVVAQLSWEKTTFESSVAINEPLIESYVKTLRQVGERHNLSDTLTIGDLITLPDFWTANQNVAEAEFTEELITQALSLALDKLKETRLAEGQKLAETFIVQMERIRQTVTRIQELAAGQVDHYRAKLTSRIEELMGGNEFDAQRLAQEVAYMAERSDITEECQRLDIHCRHFSEDLQSPEPVGRRLNFLLQELNREVNTIGSKSVDIEISGMVVTLKDELEKIREQVQNIE
jgi:uncharacterized protein (TIGR00255 family)